MSQPEKDTNPFSPDSWMEAQRKYWEAWQDMARQASKTSSGPTPGANPWAQGLDQWWKSVSPALPPDAQTFYQHLVDLGRGYFSMAENLMDKQGQTPTDAFKAWMDLVSQSLHSTGLHAGGQDHTKDFMAFWQMPADTWQRAASAFAPLPGDMMKGLHAAGTTGGFGKDLHEHLDRFLSTPGVGYSRENQAQYQELSRRILDYQRACQTYQTGMTQVALESMDRFRARLDDAGRREQPISSLRELFNEWVDVCEEVYGEHAMSDEYARHYGEMVNALMAVKQQGSMLVDEILEGFNIPTRNEISTLQQRLQETRREMQRMAREIAAMKQSKGPSPTKAEPKAKAKAKPRKKSAGSAKKAPPRTGKKSAAKPAGARSQSVKAKSAPKRS